MGWMKMQLNIYFKNNPVYFWLRGVLVAAWAFLWLRLSGAAL